MSLTPEYNSQRESFAALAKRATNGIFGKAWMFSFFFFPLLLPAQEALRNSLAGDAAAEATRKSLESQAYTVKSGDFRLLLTPSFGFDWNDNVYTVQAGAQDDFILKPMLQVAASYPVSQQNLLGVNLGIGYDRYVKHPELSSLQLQSGSDVSFDVFIKDVRLNIHDRIGYSKDASQRPELAGAATADTATFNNSAGLNATWDLEDVTLTAGYDHVNVISSSQQLDSENHATESFVGRVGLKLNPKITTGVEGTAAITRYDQMVLNNNSMYSAGIYADWQPGMYFHVQPRVGYSISAFQHTSTSVQTSDLNSWYADLNITHQANDVFSYTLDAGHEVKLGVQSDAIEDWYLRPSLHLTMIKNLDLSPNFSYEHGTQGAGNVAGNLQETYDYYGAGLTTGYAITKKFNVGLTYRLTIRSSTTADRSYSQNDVGLLFTYHP